MIWDPIIWLLLLIILLLLMFFWYFRREQAQQEPWVLYDSIGVPERTTQTQCGDSGDLVSANDVQNMSVHVEFENRGDCKVTLSVGGQNFLEAIAPQPGLGGRGVTYVAAFITLPRGQKITYACATDEEGAAQCIFRARITVR